MQKGGPIAFPSCFPKWTACMPSVKGVHSGSGNNGHLRIKNFLFPYLGELVAIESKYIKVEGLNIHYLTAGEGSPVLLLHGGGVDSASLSYGFSIGPISHMHRVLAPDWPGYGNSDKPEIEYTIAYYIDFLGHFMDALGLERVSLVGFSMGGAIALGFTLQSPQRVDKLVLVDSYGLGKEIPLRAISYMLVRLPLLHKIPWMIRKRSRGMIRRSLRRAIYDPKAITDDFVDEVWQLMRIPGAERAVRSWRKDEVRWGGLRTNFLDRLNEITLPTLFLHGMEDRLVPVSWAQRASSLVKGSRLHAIQQCGHCLPREKTHEFNQAVLEFLAKG